MNCADIIQKYGELSQRADELGFDLMPRGNGFSVDISHADGLIFLSSFEEAETFIRGYELGRAELAT